MLLAAVPEDAYSRIEMYVSYDSKFILAEDRRSNLVLEDGVAMRLSKKDVNWCSKCYVYILINVETEQRYYLTTKALTSEPKLTSAVPLEITVNPFQMECLEYFVQNSKRTLELNIVESAG